MDLSLSLIHIYREARFSKSGESLTQMIDMLLERLAVYDDIIQIMLYKLKFDIMKNLLQKATTDRISL